MQRTPVKRILRKIAEKHDISFLEAEAVPKAFFEFVAKVIKESDRETCDFKHIKLVKWGTFYVTKGRKNFFIKLNRAKRNGEENPCDAARREMKKELE